MLNIVHSSVCLSIGIYILLIFHDLIRTAIKYLEKKIASIFDTSL